MGSSRKDFIEETIKEKPVSKKKFAVRLLLTLVIAAAAACVAAFVFVNMIPVAEKLSGKEETKNKISITSEDAVTPEATETPAPTSEPTETPAPLPEDPDDEKTEDGTKEDGDWNQVTEIVKEEIIYKELTIDDYITLHEKISEIAERAERSIVSVTGITSMLDYFENTYENSQTITGVIVADSGEELYILTGYSVLEKVERIQVTFEDGYISDAYFLRNDPDTGLAVIKVNVSGLPEETHESLSVAPFSTLNNARAGERIIALGTILGHSGAQTIGTVISASDTFSASDCEYDVIPTDIGAAGNSSGVLINLRGAISGIIIPADKRGTDASLTAFTSEGIKDLIESLSNNEDRPYLGLRGMDVTDSIAERSGVPKGILITSIENDSPAMLAGIMENDILVKIDDTSVMTMADYESALSEYEPDADIRVVVMRMGNEGYTEVEFKVTVGEI